MLGEAREDFSSTNPGTRPMARTKSRNWIEELLAEPFPQPWESWLWQTLCHYRLLNEAERKCLRDDARVLLAEKRWEGCDGLKVTELIKLTVAAQAALLLLGLEHDYFSRVRSVVMFPAAFELPSESRGERGWMVSGQAVDYGTVYLSWETVLAEARDPAAGHNLVIHEFAHQLDFLDGYTNGTPPLRGREQTRRWHTVMQRTFHRLRRDLQKGLRTFLGSYAATNPTEFFSVASEKFFSLPAQLRGCHPELFAVLAEYYRVEPLRWFDGNTGVELASGSLCSIDNAAGEGARGATGSVPEPVDTDFIDYRCPYCQNPVSFPKPDADTLKQCPNCLDLALVPERSGLPAARIPIPLRTERLVLRRFQALDAKDLAEVASNPQSLRYVDWKAMSLEDVEEWIVSQRRIRYPQIGEWFCLAIEPIQAAKVIGFVTFWLWGENSDAAQFEIVIHPEWQRQGYGTETARGLLRFGFSSLHVRRIVAQCDSRNLAARKLLLKAGLRQESEYIQDRLVKGEWVNTIGYALLRREFAGGCHQP
jgi:MtfA peptidase